MDMKIRRKRNKIKRERVKEGKEKVPYTIYSEIPFWRKFFIFWYWLGVDMIRILKYGRSFNEYGMTVYAGRQGYGKTASMVEYLERMRKKYPKAIILTNFNYKYEHMKFEDWHQFYDVRNGLDGVIFAIDEIQNEWESTKWKDFPETLLSEITQQRKQRIKIISSTQVYTRMVKPLREQTFDVIECRTLANRWTFMKSFDALEYESVISQPALKNSLKRNWRRSFIQTDKFRDLYDTSEKVEKMKRTDYLPRQERGAV